MSNFSSEHKESVKTMIDYFNKFVVGGKCTAYEITDFMQRGIELMQLEDCKCKEKEPALEKMTENGKK